MIKPHFSYGHYAQTLDFFRRMQVWGCVSNAFTVSMIVGSCVEFLWVKWGQCVHGLGFKVGCFKGNSAVGDSFVYVYSKCGEMGDACRVFDEMSVRDVVACTALIVECVQNDETEMGLSYFCKMHKVGEKPNCQTIEGGLQACGNLGDVFNGKCLHAYALKEGNGYLQFVQSSLLLMYSKCGSSEEAYLAFCDLPEKDLISYIAGLLRDAGRSGSRTGMPGSHSHAGLIQEDRKHFYSMARE